MENSTIDWEDFEAGLRSNLRGRRLVLEIGLTAQLQKNAEAALARVVRFSHSPEEVAKAAPATLAVCLVAHGVYRYEHGNYWDGFPIRAIDHKYGRAFESVLDCLDLEDFSEMVREDRATRYVARILAHGGIPKYSLGDYFGLVERALRAGAEDASDMLALWRSRRSSFAGIDQPVRRFLLYGRAISRDYLDRTIDLFREWAAIGRYPTPEAAALPVSVITELRRLSESGTIRRVTHNSQRSKGARPRFTCDPWDSLGPTVVLPATDANQAAAVWTVASDNGVHRVLSHQNSAMPFPVNPSRQWEVTLTNDHETIIDVAFEGLDEIPVLFFSPSTGALAAPGLGLSAEDYWVLRPADKPLVSGTSDDDLAEPNLIEILPEPTGEWSGFAFEHIDLTDCRVLGVGSDASRRYVNLRAASRPDLRGTFLDPTISGDTRRVCTADLAISVPEGEINWQVSVRVESEAHSLVLPPGGSADLTPMLPTDRAAAVSVAARGVLGSDLHEQFTWVPALSVQVPERLALPGDPLPTVILDSPCAEPLEWDTTRVNLQPEHAANSVEVSVDGLGDPVVVRVELPILRWGRSTSGRVELGSDIVGLSSLDFLEDHAPALTVSTGRPGTRLELTLEESGRQLQSWDPVRASGRQGQFRYDLRRLSDTVGGLDHRCDLILYVGDGRAPVRVATITPHFEFSDLTASGIHTGEEALVVVSFTENRRAPGRVLRLWPLHRPWEEPQSTPISDGASGEAEIAPEPPPQMGDYIAELTIDDGFSSPVRPDPTSPAVTALRLGDPRDIHADRASRAENDATAVIESVLADGMPIREVRKDEYNQLAAPALIAWSTISSQTSTDWHERQVVDSLVSILAADPSATAKAVEDMAEHELLSGDGLLKLAILLAHRLPVCGGAALRSTWRLEPALACMLDVGIQPGTDDGAASEFLGWEPANGIEAIEEGGQSEGARVSQRWLGCNIEQLQHIRGFLQFEVRPRPLSQDGRIAAIFEWLSANQRDELRSVERWRSAHHPLERRPVPISDAIHRHLDARSPAKGAASWGDFGRLTLVAALHVCGRTDQKTAGQRALLDSAMFAPLQTRRDLALAWVLINDLLRDHEIGNLPTELL